jgi:hypothetical protein
MTILLIIIAIILVIAVGTLFYVKFLYYAEDKTREVKNDHLQKM